MSLPSVSWNENSPAGTDNLALGDNRIRELKTQIREVIDVDHDFPSSGQAADVGQHKKVTLQEQANLGTGAEGATILGSQTCDGKGELVYTDEDDNDIQLTKGGKFYPGTAPTTTSWADVLKLVYPVGSVYTNASDSTNPATLFGFGTWAAIEGECVVGLKSGDANFGSVGTVAAGATTHTLTTEQIPSHTHSYSKSIAPGAGDSGACFGTHSTQDSGSTGGGEAHNNIQPSYVCYIWRRTA